MIKHFDFETVGELKKFLDQFKDEEEIEYFCDDPYCESGFTIGEISVHMK